MAPLGKGIVATCHPEKRHVGLGLCENCYRMQWRKKNEARTKELKRENYLRNRDKYIARSKERYASRDCRQHSIKVRARVLLQKYGISLDQYEQMLALQGGRCKICKDTPSGRWARLVVDHDHSDGHVRGLLCTSCNLKLGWMESHQPNIEEYLDRRK